MILGTLAVLIVLFAAQGIYRNWDVYRGRSTTFDAMAEHLNEQTEINNAFPDDSQWANRRGLLGVLGRGWKWLQKNTKPWEVFGPLSKYSWARWRTTPLVLIAAKGAGRWRLERDFNKEQPEAVLEMGLHDRKKIDKFPDWYLSRVQYWSRWHFAVQWPFQVTFHIYWREADVPAFPARPTNRSIKKMFFFYGPTHRDADKQYWIASWFLGGTFK